MKKRRAGSLQTADTPNGHPSEREAIAAKAYELYEERGRQDGYDLDDWFKAEVFVKESGADARVSPAP